MSPADIVKAGGVALHELGINAAIKKPEGYLLFDIQIRSCVTFLDGNWDDFMVKEASDLAYQEANWMTVAEVKFFISKIKTGKYPTNKNFTPMFFMECLTSFIHEVLSLRRMNQEKKAKAAPVQSEISNTTPQVDTRAAIRQLIKRFKDIEEEQRKEAEQARHERNEALKIHRDQQIVELVEADMKAGIQPNKYLLKAYEAAKKNLSE